MAEEVNFLELACLLKVTQNTVLERFGSSINASIFDASNIAGTLKQHGLIDFTAYYPGPNEIVVTDAGKKLIAEADAKAGEPYDQLDEAILAQLSGGKRMPADLQNTLNLRPKDLALRLYKLNKQGYMIYELKSGGVDLLLTETGFLKAGTAPTIQKPRQHQQMQQEPAVPAQQPAQAPGTAPQQQQPAPAAQQPTVQGEAAMHGPAEPVKLHGKPFSKTPMMPLAVVVIIVIILLALFYLHII